MITEEMLARSRAIQPSVEWTNYVRSQYSPAADSKVVVAWDTQTSRWVLAYDSEDFVVHGNSLFPVRWTKAFYVWAGPGDAYKPPGPEMVTWLRDHDVHSEKSPEEWHKRMVSPDKRLANDRDKSQWDDVTYGLKHLYDAHGKPMSSQVGPMSHNLGKGPNAGSKYFGPKEHNVGMKDDSSRTKDTGPGSAG